MQPIVDDILCCPKGKYYFTERENREINRIFSFDERGIDRIVNGLYGLSAQNVADVRAAPRPALRGVGCAHVELAPLAAHHRPADAGQQVDPRHGDLT